MKRLSASTTLATVLLAACLALPAQAGVSCHLINAKGVGKDLGLGKTAADVIGGGLLEGTLAGTITVTGPPVSGLAPFMETIISTNNHGSLTIVVTGAIDITTGNFNASGPVTVGTGKLSDATGNVSLTGVVNFASGVFTEDISGVVCVNLGH